MNNTASNVVKISEQNGSDYVLCATVSLPVWPGAQGDSVPDVLLDP